MFQVEYLEDGSLPHVFVECIDDGAFLGDGINDNNLASVQTMIHTHRTKILGLRPNL